MEAPGPWNYADPYEYIGRVERSTMPPLIITVAITGALAGKEESPYVPESPREQAEATYAAYKAGASAVHIHARDETGAVGSADPDRFREVNRLVRELCPDIIVGNSTGLEPWRPREDSMRVLDAEPEVASLNMGLIGGRKVVQKKRLPPLQGRPEDVTNLALLAVTWEEVERIARICLEKNIKPEMEVYYSSMLWQVQNLLKKDLLKKPYWLQLIFSSRFEFPTADSLTKMVHSLPRDCMFSVIGVGPHQLPITTMSIIMGGHVRVGLEDNLFYKRGELATNVQLVERTVRIAKELGREIATPSQAREMLGISQTPRRW